MSEINDLKTSAETSSERPKQPLILLTILALTLITATSNGLYGERPEFCSVFSLLAFPPGAGAILMFILTHWKGRRALFMTLYILSLSSSLIYLILVNFFESRYKTICLLLHAPVQGSSIALLYIVICEYCAPERRFLFLVANSAIHWFFYWITVVIQAEYQINFLGEYLQYFNVILGVFGLWSVYRWPESPYWLASKRRFEESANAFVEVRGRGSETSEELHVLTDPRSRPGSTKMVYAPLLLALPVLCMSVTNPDAVYIYQNFLSKDVQKFYERFEIYFIFLSLKCISALASVLIALNTVEMPRKVLFLCCGFISAGHIYIIYYVSHDMLIVDLIYDVIVDCGPRTVTLPLLIELIPQKYINLVTLFITMVYIAIESCFVGYQLLLAGSPYILVPVIICYYLMPEVKEKTLIEIEQLYVSKKEISLQPIQTDL